MQNSGSGDMSPPSPGTTFKNGPRPQPTGWVPAVVGPPQGPVVVQTGEARTNGPAPSKPGP